MFIPYNTTIPVDSEPIIVDCGKLSELIGTGVVTILLVLSELLPFIKSIESNGLTEHIINLIRRKDYRQIRNQQSEDHLNDTSSD